MANLIVIGLDGSNHSWKALDEALQQAKCHQCAVHIVTVAEQNSVSPSAMQVLTELNDEEAAITKLHLKAAELCKDAGVKFRASILHGDSVGAIIQYIKENGADLLVIGDKGRSSVWDALLGTNTEKFMRQATCSVLIVR